MDRIFNQEITATMAKVWMEMIDTVLSLAEKDKAEKMLLFLDKKMLALICLYYMLPDTRSHADCSKIVQSCMVI